MNSTDPQSAPTSTSTPDATPTTASRPRFRLPPEFQDFTHEQLENVNDTLRSHTYEHVQEMIYLNHGIRISINKLFRYFQKVQMAEQLELAEDTTDAVEQLLALYNGQFLDLDKAGLETIKRRALALAASPSTKPTMLLQLMRIFTWEHRKSLDDHRKQMDLAKKSHRNRLAKVAERRAQCEERRVALLEARQQRSVEQEPSNPHSNPNESAPLFQIPTPENPCYSEEELKILNGPDSEQKRRLLHPGGNVNLIG